MSEETGTVETTDATETQNNPPQAAPQTTEPSPTTETKTNGQSAGDITTSVTEDAPAPATWPDDWRQKLAGKDEATLKRLNRFQSPEGVFKSWRSLEQKLSSGEFRAALPEDASDEQVTEWRKANGIPEEAGQYNVPEVQGYEWSEDDKPMLENFLSAAHASNMDQGKVDAVLSWYANQQQQLVEHQFETDTKAKQDLEDELRTEWGPEFRSNVGLMKRYLEHDVPEEGGESLLDARLADGSRLIDKPWFAKWVTDLARNTYGDVSFASGQEAARAEGRIDEIRKILQTDYPRYVREGLDKEYLALLEKSEKRGGR